MIPPLFGKGAGRFRVRRFDFTELFASGRPGTVILPGTPFTELYTERSDPGTPAGFGDPVGTIVDKVTGLIYQAPTDNARAVYGRRPVGGVTNGVTRTETFESPWFNSRTARGNIVPGPLGSDAIEIVETTGAGSHDFNQPYEVVEGQTYLFAAALKAGARTFGRVVLNRLVSSNLFGGVPAIRVDLTNGEIVGTQNALAGGVENLGDGWWLLWVAQIATGTGTQSCGIGVGLDADTFGYTGDGESFILFSRPQLLTGSALKPYQIVGASQLDVTEPGVRTVPYLLADGIDDTYLSTTDVDFSASDKMFVALAGTKRSDVAQGQIISNSWNNVIGFDGGFFLAHSSSLGDSGRRTYIGHTRGSEPRAQKTIGIFAAPDTAVVDMRLDNAAPDAESQITLAHNGVVSALSTANGTNPGNFASNRALRLFSRAGTEHFSPYDLTGLIILGGSITSAERMRIRRALSFQIGVPLDV